MELYAYTIKIRSGVAQWVAPLTRNVEVVVSSPIKGTRCFLEQETLPLLLSTGWFRGTDSSVISQSNKNKLRALWIVLVDFY